MRRYRGIVLWWAFRSLCRLVVALGRLLFRLDVEGLEHFPTMGPAILVGRRISRVDFFGAALLFSLLKRGEFSGLTGLISICNSRFLAWGGRELGVLPTLKGKSLSAASLLEAYNLLQQGKIIANADEGEVPWDGRLQPLRSGVAWLALRTHAPVVVGVLLGGYDIWPRWARRPRLGGKLRLRIGKPFYLSAAPCKRVTTAMLEEANQRLIVELDVLSDGYMLREGRQP